MWSIFSRDSASSFPFEILDPVDASNTSNEDRNIWKLHKGRKKQNGDEVTVFVCDKPGTELELAHTAVKKLKTLRHPCVLTYVDSFENDKLVYLVTEPVSPLLLWLNETKLSPAHRVTTAAWGLLQVTKGLSFLNNDGKMTHFNICNSSIYVTHGGEWKIGGVEYISSDSTLYPVKITPHLYPYNPPEKNNPSKMRTTTQWSADMWGLGCLLWEVFNGPLDQSMSLQSTSKIPKSLLPTYCELVGANPSQRPNPQDVLSKLQKKGQFFHNDLIQTLLFLEEIQIKDDAEKHRFLSELSKKLDNIPHFVSKNKILPAVIQAHEFANVGSVVLSPLFKIGKLLDEQEYQKQVLPCVVKLFSSSDRATRLKLLQQIEDLIEHMDPKTVNDQIYPQLSSGFLDTNPVIREYTVKAIFFLAPKLNQNNLNVEVLKHFARLQARDDQGGIRTNTTVCLGKIASYLNPTTRQKCLVSAFTRAMRDPFHPQRMAGATALAATQQYYPLNDVATKVLPVLCPMTMDPEKSVRDAAFKVLKGFLSKLEKVSEDPTLLEKMESEVMTATGSTAQVSSWAGWAMGAVASKFYKSDVSAQNKVEGKQSSERLSSTSSDVTSNTTKSSLAGSPEPQLSKNPSRTGFGADDDASDYEDWDNSSWNNDINGTEEEKPSLSTDKLTTITEALSGLDTQGSGDGWHDEDDWGSLENTDNTITETEDNIPCNIKSTSSLTWGSQESPLDDFFTSSGTSMTSTSESRGLRSTKEKKPDSWDDWNSDTTNIRTSMPTSALEEREQKKLQRKKEIEAKRAARAGPMKLGAKKLQL